jgi:hypothetical protein
VPPLGYPSTIVERPATIPSAKTIERRRRALALAKKTFPNEIPDPYTTVKLLNRYDSTSTATLPFICATIVITSEDDKSKQEFTSVWCLWDTGAQVSQILSSQLGARIRGNQTTGFATMSLKYVTIMHHNFLQSNTIY